MPIRVWRAFSCNNSAAYRVVARFADAATSSEIAAELRSFTMTFDSVTDQLVEGDVEAANTLAQKYGFSWSYFLDQPQIAIAAEGEVLVVEDGYCLEIGDEVLEYLKARGAWRIESEIEEAATVSLLFSARQGHQPRLDHDLDELFAALATRRPNQVLALPWPTTELRAGVASGFRDARTVGLYLPFAVDSYAACKQWLADHQIEGALIRLCETADAERFAKIARARCTACKGPLEYLDPRMHDIETRQLVCRPCGGFYELAAFGVS